MLDLAGNVREWCLNKVDEPEMTQPDTSDDRRVVRGGSWGISPVFARASFRNGFRPYGLGGNLGFRLCCAPPIP